MPLPDHNIDKYTLDLAIEHCQRKDINAHDRKCLVRRLVADPFFDNWAAQCLAQLAGVNHLTVITERERQQTQPVQPIWDHATRSNNPVRDLVDLKVQRLAHTLKESRALLSTIPKELLTAEHHALVQGLTAELETLGNFTPREERHDEIQFVDDYADATHALQNNHFFQARALDGSWGRRVPWSSEFPIRVTSLEAEAYLTTNSIYMASNHDRPSETKLTVEELETLIRQTI